MRSIYRTREPRIIAGVCGGLARATNTDPILFRVILAVLVFFGGIGALLYLLGWLLLPMEGDSASPAEALLGKGHSSTSAVITVLLGIACVGILIATLNSGVAHALLLAAILIGIGLLLRRNGHAVPGLSQRGPLPSSATGPPGAATPPADPASGPSGGFPPSAAPTSATPQPPAGPQASASAAESAMASSVYGPAGVTATVPPQPPMSPSSGSGTAYGAAGDGATSYAYAPYSAPFAPHGPYGQTTYPPLPVRPPKPPKQKSILGRLTLSLICFALAVLAIVDAAGVNIGFTQYVALALLIVVLGLLVGTWFGRARWLIALGLVLTFALAIGTVVQRADSFDFGRAVTWTPTSITDLNPKYETESGKVTLDLRGIDFTDNSRTVEVNVGAGDVNVMLPPKVDVTVATNVGVGSAKVLGSNSDGVGLDRRASDDGVDGPGGGNLHLDVNLGAGNLEVTR